MFSKLRKKIQIQEQEEQLRHLQEKTKQQALEEGYKIYASHNDKMVRKVLDEFGQAVCGAGKKFLGFNYNKPYKIEFYNNVDSKVWGIYLGLGQDSYSPGFGYGIALNIRLNSERHDLENVTVPDVVFEGFYVGIITVTRGGGRFPYRDISLSCMSVGKAEQHLVQALTKVYQHRGKPNLKVFPHTIQVYYDSWYEMPP